MKKFVSELVGTFFLMLTLLMVRDEYAPLIMGIAVSGMMLVSKGHLNPAISMAMMVQRRILRDEMPVYWVGQIAGAILATTIAGVLASCTVPATSWTLITPRAVCGLICEFLGAFALVYAFLAGNATNTDSGKWAVGLTLVAMTAIFWRITGAFFNPALAVGGAISGIISWGNMLMFWICHFLGSALGVTVYSLLHSEEVVN